MAEHCEQPYNNCSNKKTAAIVLLRMRSLLARSTNQLQAVTLERNPYIDLLSVLL